MDIQNIFTMFYNLLQKEEIKDLLKWLKFLGDEQIAESLLELNTPLNVSDRQVGYNQLE